MDYGFIESTPDRNTYTLTLPIPESDPFFGDKLDIAESNGLAETAYFDIVLGRSLPEQMLPFLRLLALGGTDAFLLESIFSNKIWDHLNLPVSQTNEELVCRVVRDACKSALSGYHTSIEEVNVYYSLYIICIFFFLNVVLSFLLCVLGELKKMNSNRRGLGRGQVAAQRGALFGQVGRFNCDKRTMVVPSLRIKTISYPP